LRLAPAKFCKIRLTRASSVTGDTRSECGSDKEFVKTASAISGWTYLSKSGGVAARHSESRRKAFSVRGIVFERAGEYE